MNVFGREILQVMSMNALQPLGARRSLDPLARTVLKVMSDKLGM